jgi:hypothetical protein
MSSLKDEARIVERMEEGRGRRCALLGEELINAASGNSYSSRERS